MNYGLTRKEYDAICDRFESLTPLQKEIAYLVAEGLRDNEIATLINSSAKNVNSIIFRIFNNLEISAERFTVEYNSRILLARVVWFLEEREVEA